MVEVVVVDPVNPGLMAGIIQLIYQVIDAFANPISGYISDNYDFKFGKRRSLYFFGFIMLFFTFIAWFQDCFICGLSDSYNLKPL